MPPCSPSRLSERIRHHSMTPLKSIIMSLCMFASSVHGEGGRPGAAAPAVEPVRTIMQCLGVRTYTRACHFENVYYEIETGRFVYFGVEGSSVELFGEVAPGDPWLKLVRNLENWESPEEKSKQFFLDWRSGEPLPYPHEVVSFSRPLHLRATYNPMSIGHLLRDNIQYLIDLPLRFGRDPTTFDWVRWESEMTWTPWEEEVPTMQHYQGLFNNRPSVTWQEVVNQSLAGQDPGVKYIMFKEIIGGTGPADVQMHMGSLNVDHPRRTISMWAHLCSPYPFMDMRRVAYQNFGMEVPSVSDLSPFVLFVDGQHHEIRHMANAPELIPRLRDKFPGVRMEHVVISELPLKEQLDLLSKATILVTSIGSRSFRLIYLPDDASVVLIGPPEFEFEIQPDDANEAVTREKLRQPFQEIEWCWGYIGYVNFFQYHVEQKEEVTNVEDWKLWRDARNTDVVLNEDKITRILQVALNSQKAQTARSRARISS